MDKTGSAPEDSVENRETQRRLTMRRRMEADRHPGPLDTADCGLVEVRVWRNDSVTHLLDRVEEVWTVGALPIDPVVGFGDGDACARKESCAESIEPRVARTPDPTPRHLNSFLHSRSRFVVVLPRHDVECTRTDDPDRPTVLHHPYGIRPRTLFGAAEHIGTITGGDEGKRAVHPVTSPS